jgi:hypothetical protein
MGSSHIQLARLIEALEGGAQPPGVRLHGRIIVPIRGAA